MWNLNYEVDKVDTMFSDSVHITVNLGKIWGHNNVE